MNALYYGDNLAVLRESIADESVDLVYLDPPFNSNASYNVLFKAPSGEGSQAQIEAFEDSWHWNETAERAFDEVVTGPHSDATIMLKAMRSALGENDMMAYLAMMAVRPIELHRVLKPTGSLYLHCDPVASHYLKILLDSIMGPTNFRSEIIWRRSPSHNKLTKQYGPIHDTVLFFAKSEGVTFHPGQTPYTRSYIEGEFRLRDEGGQYRLNEVMGAGTRTGDSGKPWHGYDPSTRGRHWAIPASIGERLGTAAESMTTQEQLDALLQLGLIVLSKTGRPKYKQYPGSGVAYQDIWAYQPGTEGVLFGSPQGIDEDVKWLSNEEEKLGYPTQKPVGLLERIISASSNEGDIVLDPFCGCGTTVHAAQKLNRRWIGIDVTNLAIALVERRLKEAFPGIVFEVHGVPKDVGGARNLAERDKHEFQKWITATIGAQPYKGGKKGMDRGIDGYLHFRDADKKPQFAIVSVKGGENITSGMVRDLKGTMDREKAALGLFLTLNDPTREMEREAASAGFYETGGMKVPRLQILTAAQILDDRRPQVPFGFSEGFKKAAREEAEQKRLL
jgi:site-specific DNA-methyltransferase (adenine-specific)